MKYFIHRKHLYLAVDIARCISVVGLFGLGLVGLGMMIYFIVTFGG